MIDPGYCTCPGFVRGEGRHLLGCPAIAICSLCGVAPAAEGSAGCAACSATALGDAVRDGRPIEIGGELHTAPRGVVVDVDPALEPVLTALYGPGWRDLIVAGLADPNPTRQETL